MICEEEKSQEIIWCCEDQNIEPGDTKRQNMLFSPAAFIDELM